jgi:DNA polymerase
MADAYQELLNATVRHLEQMRRRGVKRVKVSPEALRAISGSLPPASPAPAAEVGETLLPAAAPSAARPLAPLAPAPVSASPIVSPPEISMASTESIDARPALSPQAKPAALEALRARVLPCVKCAHLAASRTQVVFGVGTALAELMFVGEAPGADEDAQGEPFVGAAGQLLTKIILATGLSRSQVYIANILKCRPDTPGQSSGNRKPTPSEMVTCLPYLAEQIEIIRPKVLVALGATAVEGLLGKTEGITKLRGKWRLWRGVPLMPTYHPAYLLRNQAMTEKRKVWEDMMQVMERLGMPISEKQRHYFLKA